MPSAAASRRRLPTVALTMSDVTAVDRRFGAGGPTLAEVGETALLDHLVAIAEAEGGEHRAALRGDDAGVWTPRAGRDLAISIDALVEDVDFRRPWITPRQLGGRAFRVAVSDLAATGADAEHCLATLCARPSEQLEDVLGIQRGLCAAAAAAGCAVTGGDVSAIDGPLVIDVCVVGSLPAGRALRRSAGHIGDALLVTGVLGRAAAGLRLLSGGAEPTSAVERAWVAAQLEPQLRLREGSALLNHGVRCGADISDGLVLDTMRTARASDCAVELWAAALPVDAELRACFGNQWLELAIAGGEDFELVVAVAEAEVDALLQQWPAELASLTRVGSLRAGSGVHLLDAANGAELPLPHSSAGHF